jgi:hypothetical protein
MRILPLPKTISATITKLVFNYARSSGTHRRIKCVCTVLFRTPWRRPSSEAWGAGSLCYRGRGPLAGSSPRGANTIYLQTSIALCPWRLVPFVESWNFLSKTDILLFSERRVVRAWPIRTADRTLTGVKDLPQRHILADSALPVSRSSMVELQLHRHTPPSFGA